MTKKKNNEHLEGFLRRQSGKIDRKADAATPEEATEKTMSALLHDLRVHQSELETQNNDLRQTQAVLAAARERYFDFYDLAPVGYFTLSPKGLIIEANLTLATWLRLDRGALSMQPLNLYIRREDQDVFYLFMKRLLKARETQSCELWLVKKDGTEFCAQLDATASKGSDGIELYRAVVTDVTARKMAAEELRENEQKYRQLFEMVSDALFLIDTQSGKIIEANIVAVKLYGYSREELLCMRHVDLSAEPQETKKASIDAGSSGSVTIPIRYHRKKDGTVFPVEITATALLWKGRPAIIPAIREITERIQNQKIMERLERMTSLGTLAGGVAHEINQPLHALKMTADAAIYLHDKGLLLVDTEKIADKFRFISRQVDRISTIVRRLRDFVSRAHSDCEEEINLDDIEKRVIELVGERLKVHDIDLQVNRSADPPVIWGNSARLEEVFINLIVNAMQVMDLAKQASKKIVITIQCQSDKVLLEIFNNGGNIPENIIDKIFDPFFTTKINVENMGLGLSIVHSIVSAHEGKISAINHSAGVSFRIEFPRYVG